MRPIPRKLLIHSAELFNVTADRWQGETPTPVANLSFIRLEPSDKLVLSKDNTEKQLAAALIYDCHNSLPKNVAFAVGQKITTGGAEYHIETVEVLSDERKPHHVEVGLV